MYLYLYLHLHLYLYLYLYLYLHLHLYFYLYLYLFSGRDAGGRWGVPGTPVSPKLQGLPLLLRHHCTACAACALFFGEGSKNDRCSILVEVQMKSFKVFPCSCHCTAPASALVGLGWVRVPFLRLYLYLYLDLYLYFEFDSRDSILSHYYQQCWWHYRHYSGQ